MSTEMLNITENVHFDYSIIRDQYHTYQPTVGNFAKDDEIRILIQQQDICTLPFKSYILLAGNVELPQKTPPLDSSAVSLTRNAYNFLFQDVKIEINGVEIEKIRDVGMTTTIKGYLTNKADNKRNCIYGWEESGILTSYNKTTKKFLALIPLNKIFGFAEDYRKVFVNVRLELVILRAGTDKNCYIGTDGTNFKINKIEWHVPHIDLNDEVKLGLLNVLKTDRPIAVPHRSYDLYEYPMKSTDKDVWPVKTSTSLERPRYVIICFQDNKKNNHGADITKFNHCNIRNIKIHLNSDSYPYDNMNLDFENDNYLLAYNMYCDFQSRYYNIDTNETTPYLDYTSFKESPLFVFDVSKQNEIIKSATVDLKVEMEANKSFNANTRAYCLIIYDCITEYTPLTGIVRRVL